MFFTCFDSVCEVNYTQAVLLYWWITLNIYQLYYLITLC